MQVHRQPPQTEDAEISDTDCLIREVFFGTLLILGRMGDSDDWVSASCGPWREGSVFGGVFIRTTSTTACRECTSAGTAVCSSCLSSEGRCSPSDRFVCSFFILSFRTVKKGAVFFLHRRFAKRLFSGCPRSPHCQYLAVDKYLYRYPLMVFPFWLGERPPPPSL